MSSKTERQPGFGKKLQKPAADGNSMNCVKPISSQIKTDNLRPPAGKQFSICKKPIAGLDSDCLKRTSTARKPLTSSIPKPKSNGSYNKQTEIAKKTINKKVQQTAEKRNIENSKNTALHECLEDHKVLENKSDCLLSMTEISILKCLTESGNVIQEDQSQHDHSSKCLEEINQNAAESQMQASTASISHAMMNPQYAKEAEKVIIETEKKVNPTLYGHAMTETDEISNETEESLAAIRTEKDAQMAEKEKYKKHWDDEKSKCQQLQNLVEEQKLGFQMGIEGNLEKYGGIEGQLKEENEALMKTIEEFKNKISDTIVVTPEANHIKEEENKVLSVELGKLKQSNEDLRQHISELEADVSENCKIIEELKEKIENSVENSTVKDKEIERLRESESLRIEEIEKLQRMLKTSRNEVKQYKESILMHQNLLKIRTELIDSLQEKECSTRSKMDNLYSELNNEILKQKDEFQSAYSTVAAKQLQISRQDQLIRSLKETNLRNEELQKNQQAKIDRLETDIARLKHLLK